MTEITWLRYNFSISKLLKKHIEELHELKRDIGKLPHSEVMRIKMYERLERTLVLLEDLDSPKRR